MPFNGSGTFSRLYSWVVDAANNVAISSTRTDAELNGMAAALSNCVTRDGQSPPSADLPMGGKKLVNLGNATVSTDALNMATGDARYILSSITTLTLSGSLTAGSITTGGTLSVTGTSSLGVVNASGLLTLSGGTIYGAAQSRAGQVGYHFYNQGTVCEWVAYQPAHTTSDEYRIATVVAGVFTDRLVISPTGTVTVPGTLTASTLTVTGAATLAALTASGTITGNAGFSGTTLTLSSTLNVTGLASLNALTATGALNFSGPLTTGIAANNVGYLGVPSSVKTANYQIAGTDIGQDIAFNGTTLTCTIPAGLPDGFACTVANINASPLTITSASSTLTWSGTTTTGNRTLGQNGEARIMKRNGVIYISGTALT